MELVQSDTGLTLQDAGLTPINDEAGGFQFLREDDGSLDPQAAIFQALGAASVSWQPSGVFDSVRACQIGNALLKELGLLERS